jgi:eukaryotic-like serine/threonine-protein kinase
MSPPTAVTEPSPGSSRYELLERIASGGMATVYVGRLRGAAGFSRLVAIKRAHAHLIEEPEYRRMLIAEARLASRIHHPNVVAVQDVEELEDELLLVMDYVDGVALSKLLGAAIQSGTPVAPPLAVRMVLDVCTGLHAAHGLVDDDGSPLGIVHRDVSPHNILVGCDGISRIADFGVAKCAFSSLHATRTGVLKGKAGYMAPEYVQKRVSDARGDVFALTVVLWEALANRRLFRGDDEVDTLQRIGTMRVPPVSEVCPALGTALDPVVAKGLERSPARRFASALELGEALERTARAADLIGSYARVGALVQERAGARLARLRALARGREEPAIEPGTAVIAVEATQETQGEDSATLPTPRGEGDGSTVTGTVSPHGLVAAPVGRRRLVLAALGVAAVVAVGAGVARWQMTARPAAMAPEEPAAAVEPPAPATVAEPPAPTAEPPAALPPAPPPAAIDAPSTASAAPAAPPPKAPPRLRPSASVGPRDKAPPNPYPG